MSKILFSPLKTNSLTFKNRVVMAPMTRSRATADHTPIELMAEYYAQRAGAGLIITEGTSPSPNGTGYARIPGIYSDTQVAEWKKVTDAVHQKGGLIFIQLMHTGRIGHKLNLPEGAEVLAPSAVKAEDPMYTDQEGMQPVPVPRAFTTEEVKSTIDEFVKSAENAVKAGFDGIELHGANGYLIEQFLNPSTNLRTDEYGGGIEGRCKFLLEVVEKSVAAIGKEKVGIRLSPYGAFGNMAPYDEVDETYNYLSQKLNDLDILYLHVLDHSSLGSPAVPESIFQTIRSNFKNVIIRAGGLDAAKAEELLQNGAADLVAFGRAFISNPDLPHRMENNLPLSDPDPNTFYTPGEQGYTDYAFAKDISSKDYPFAK